MSMMSSLCECDFVQHALKRPHTEMPCVSKDLEHFARLVRLYDLPTQTSYIREEKNSVRPKEEFSPRIRKNGGKVAHSHKQSKSQKWRGF